MAYVTDTMRVETSLPIHIMLSVLLSGANCADPGHAPNDVQKIPEWRDKWLAHNKRLKGDDNYARSYETFKETKALLMEACKDALFDIYPMKKEISVLRRIERVHVEMVKPYIQDEKADPRKIGIIAYYLLQHLIDTNTMIIPEDSAFGLALNHMLPALSPPDDATAGEDAAYESLNKSARKQVRKIVQHLQNEGYYLGIPLPDFH